MADREKVIKGLQCCKSPNDHEHCPYNTGVHYNVCTYRLLSDALELLKEQEPVEPKLVGVNTWTCGECGALIGFEEFAQSGLELVKYKFCSECGRKVKWDENKA